ncbi:LysM peptidoglycan-binding domain-containing protein [uncultured Brachyspira sp.]|uniref:LysM peptidoglycan-binding domain-containing protein n=1 Tax=uncultured Brachyspira sp. TaxID=221953 RepID=UPI00261A0760|nr:LysM peptidoglycan-binding domain-containing protein [uncultured Brachyspira sp.]
MKKGLFLFVILSFSCFLYSQETNTLSLPPELPSDLPSVIKESDDYKLAQRYREMAIEAHEVGDYNQSIEYSKQSKEYSDKIISRYGVYEYVLNSQRKAERNLALFKGVGGDTNELTSNLYTSSVEDINSANNMFDAAANGTDFTNTMLEYDKSAEKSELGYNVLAIDLRREYLISESVLTNGDNNDTQITNLRDESKTLLASNDYTNSLTKSRDAMNILDRLEAPLAYAKAQEAMEKAKNDGYDESKPNLYKDASKSLSSAGETLVANNYSDSLMHSKNVISIVNSMGISEDKEPEEEIVIVPEGSFPKYYTVQSRKTNTDSLWRIASYDFIYGNGNLWKKIYEANKDKIKDPSIIRAGQVLTIPSLKGELREGTYDPNQTYNSIKNYTTNQQNQIQTNQIQTNQIQTNELQTNQMQTTNTNAQQEAVPATPIEDNAADTTEEEMTADEAEEEMTSEETAGTEEATVDTEQKVIPDDATTVKEGNIVIEDEEVLEEEQEATEDSVVDEQQTDNPEQATTQETNQ